MKNKRILSGIITILIPILISFSFSDTYAADINAKKDIKAARKAYYEENNTSKAIELLKKVHKYEPENIDCLELMVEIYFDTQDSLNTKVYSSKLLDVISAEKNILSHKARSKKEETRLSELDNLQYIIEARLKWANEKLHIKEESTDKKTFSDPEKEPFENLSKSDNRPVEKEIQSEEKKEMQAVAPSQESLNYSQNQLLDVEHFIDFSSSDPNKQKTQIAQELSEFFKSSYKDLTSIDDYKRLLGNYQAWVNHSSEKMRLELTRLNKLNEGLIENISRTNRSLQQKWSVQKEIVFLKDRLSKVQQDISFIEKTIISLENTSKLGLEDYPIYSVQHNNAIFRFKLTDYDLNHIIKYIQEGNLGKIQVHGVIKGIKTIDKIKYTVAIINYSSISGWDPHDFKYANIESFVINGTQVIKLKDSTTYSFQELDLNSYEIGFINKFSGTGQPGSNVDFPVMKIDRLLDYYNSELISLKQERENLQSDLKTLNEQTNLYNETIQEYKTFRQNYDQAMAIIPGFNPQLKLNPEEETEQIDDQLKQMAYDLYENAVNSKPNIITGQYIPEARDVINSDSVYSVSITNVNYNIELSGFKIIDAGSVKLDSKDNLFLLLAFKTNSKFDIHKEDPVIVKNPDTPNKGEEAQNDESEDAPVVVEPSDSRLITERDANVEPAVSVGDFQIIKEEKAYSMLMKGNVKWKFLEENPSSYTAYKMFQEEEGWIIPDLSQLKDLVDFFIANKNDQSFSTNLKWPLKDGIIISSEIHFDSRNNRLHKAISLSADSYQVIEVRDGTEVYIVVKSDQ